MCINLQLKSVCNKFTIYFQQLGTVVFSKMQGKDLPLHYEPRVPNKLIVFILIKMHHTFLSLRFDLDQSVK